MLSGRFDITDIEPYLNAKLPGFEPKLIHDEGQETVTLRVRGVLPFASYVEMSGGDFFAPMRSYRIQEQLDVFVRETRRNAIKMFGLQEEIDAEVKRTIDRERASIEAKAHKDAYEKALRTVASTLAPQASLEAVLHFVRSSNED